MVEVASGCVKKEDTLKYIDELWDSWFVEGLRDFVRVPNLTPMVDKEFLSNGLI